jgi:hypothetical protein
MPRGQLHRGPSPTKVDPGIDVEEPAALPEHAAARTTRLEDAPQTAFTAGLRPGDTGGQQTRDAYGSLDDILSTGSRSPSRSTAPFGRKAWRPAEAATDATPGTTSSEKNS